MRYEKWSHARLKQQFTFCSVSIVLSQIHFVALMDGHKYTQGDFCDMSNLEDNSFDGGFAFEATCHSKDLLLVYKEIHRVLKPGAIFVDLVWALTDSYDPENMEHVRVKSNVMVSRQKPRRV